MVPLGMVPLKMLCLSVLIVPAAHVQAFTILMF